MISENPILDMPIVSNELFPTFMRLHRLENAHRILIYLVRRTDNDLKAPYTEFLLRNAKRVKPEYVVDFYQNLSGLVQALERYLAFEESCTMSGKYLKDLNTTRDRIGKILVLFESDPENRTFKLLHAMLDL